MRRSPRSFTEPRGSRAVWRVLLACLVVAVVYGAGVAGNGFWGYGSAEANGAPNCTTATTGVETCITRVCNTDAGGVTTCTTITTTCSPVTTTGSRSCATGVTNTTCTTDDVSACQETGSLGDCTTSTSGFETCVNRTCWTHTGSGVTTCSTITTTCTPETTTAARRCAVAVTYNTCTTDLTNCVPTDHGKDHGNGHGHGYGHDKDKGMTSRPPAPRPTAGAP